MAVLYKNGRQIFRLQKILTDGGTRSKKIVIAMMENGWILRNTVHKYPSEYARNGTQTMRSGFKRVKNLNQCGNHLGLSAGKLKDFVAHYEGQGFKLIRTIGK